MGTSVFFYNINYQNFLSALEAAYIKSSILIKTKPLLYYTFVILYKKGGVRMNKMTVQQIADKFEVTKSGVYYWVREGLPFEIEKVIGVKPRKVIDPSDVYKFLGIKE